MKILEKSSFVSLMAVLIASSLPAEWYRGNTHAHTVLCGHADSSPEAVAKWYHDHGYHFLVLSEHNQFIDPESVKLPDNKRDDFILIPGQEITGKPIGIHTTAMNIEGLIPWENSETDTREVVIRDHIHKTRMLGGVPVLNHPHGGFPATAQDIIPVQDFHMMEVYNASTKRNNLFKRRYLNLPLTAEGLWDELLTSGMKVYGVGSDDAHTFLRIGPNESNAGLGWVMVRADALNADAIAEAMEKGDFYASNGVCLIACDRSEGTYQIEIDQDRTREMIARLPDWAGLRRESAEMGYRIEFVGRGGSVMETIRGTKGSLTIQNLDTFVRPRVVFARKRQEGGYEEFFAWGQPAFRN